jgi:Tol biopolymer transport system component
MPGEGGGPSRRVLAAMTALLTAAAGVGLAVVALRTDDRPPPAVAAAPGRIAFASIIGVHRQIVTVEADGSSTMPLTDLAADQFHPTWSPDGTRVAFDAQGDGGETQIDVVDADGSNLQTLTEGPGWNYLPAWSPDGTRIAFVSSRDGNDEIYVMNADGTGQQRLTTNQDEDLSPSWAPDGTRIAFQSNREGFNRIYVMDIDGSGAFAFTDAESFDPAWSPDGASIAFVSAEDGNPEIYVMNAEGSGVTRLTDDPSADWNPSWSLDGSKVAFESDRDGEVGIYVMNADGSDVHRLVDVQGCCPAWQPIPTGDVGPAPSGSPPTVEPAPFVPQPTIEGDTARLDVTWPDGSTAVLAYPASLELTSGGIQPDVSYVRTADPPPRHPILFLHGPPGVEAGYVEGDPRATIPIAGGGKATVWAAAESRFTRNRDIRWWLVYRTDSWAILASLEEENSADALAGSLSVSESATGFPFVSATGPVALAEGFGESEGAVLALGDANAAPDLVSDLLGGTVFLAPDACSGGPEVELDTYGSNCLGEGNVHASVYGNPSFIRSVLAGLIVESFSPKPE